jgi:hypothetical protein
MFVPEDDEMLGMEDLTSESTGKTSNKTTGKTSNKTTGKTRNKTTGKTRNKTKKSASKSVKETTRRRYLKSWLKLRGYEMYYKRKAAPCPVCKCNEFRFITNPDKKSPYWKYICTDCRTVREIYYNAYLSAFHRGKWSRKAIRA